VVLGVTRLGDIGNINMLIVFNFMSRMTKILVAVEKRLEITFQNKNAEASLNTPSHNLSLNFCLVTDTSYVKCCVSFIRQLIKRL
jgi:hypothetical protein